MEDSQRRTPRFPFSAPAEILNAGSVVSTHVTELSAYGCYMESAAPFASGARVVVRIFASGQCFEAKASVLYSQPNLGTGVAFREVRAVSQAVLHEWLQQSYSSSGDKRETCLGNGMRV
jgi:hypothetical protein